jgi:hypothetical protein
MFDSDIFKTTNFGSREERSKLLYFGWEIWTYTAGIDNLERLKEKVRQRFSGDGWAFYEYDHRVTVQYGSFEPVDVIFEEHIKSAEKFRITFKSTYLGFRVTSEKLHRKLCWMVLSRIKWKKKGFWIREGIRFPLPTYRRLRLKRG